MTVFYCRNVAAILGLVYCLLSPHKDFAQSSRMTIFSDTSQYHLHVNFPVFIDVDDQYDLDDVMALPDSVFETAAIVDNEKTGKKEVAQIQTIGSVWAVVEIKNSLGKDIEGVLTTGMVDVAELYIPNTDGTKYERKMSGRIVPVSQRDFSIGNHRECHFKVTIPAFQYVKYYICHKNPTGNPIDFDISFESYRHWEVKQLTADKSTFLFIGIVLGFMGIMGLYNLLIFFFSKDRIYLYYTMYIFLPLIYILNIQGFFTNTFVGETPLVYFYLRVLIPCFTLIFYLLFTRSFLNTSETLPKWDRFFKGLIWAEGINAFVQLFVIPLTMNEFLFRSVPTMVHFVVLVSITILLFVVTKKENKITIYFAAAAICFLGGSIFFATIIITKVLSIQVGMMGEIVGIALELIIYSLGLGYRIRKLDEERRLAQEENARILAEQNQVLEQKVLERTYEIEKQKEEILTQNEELHQQHEEIASQRDYIEEQNQDLRHKNEQITDSIRYAKTIQETILPFRKRLDENLSDYFIMYHPKDIVSGDFYWFEQVGDKKVLAVVDCTGHGVPGAFMSMIGFSILNDLVVKQGLCRPSSLLYQLDQTIQNVLKQNDEGNMDGMDVCICVFEEQSDKTVKVLFSGAKRPLYYATGDNSELQEAKGDRHSIGGYHGKAVVFTDHEIILPQKSCVYLTTDGFVDQHNAKNKKFGSQRLKNLLARIHHLPMAAQESTLNEILELHQKGQIQRDDITLIGVRL